MSSVEKHECIQTTWGDHLLLVESSHVDELTTGNKQNVTSCWIDNSCPTRHTLRKAPWQPRRQWRHVALSIIRCLRCVALGDVNWRQYYVTQEPKTTSAAEKLRRTMKKQCLAVGRQWVAQRSPMQVWHVSSPTTCECNVQREEWGVAPRLRCSGRRPVVCLLHAASRRRHAAYFGGVRTRKFVYYRPVTERQTLSPYSHILLGLSRTRVDRSACTAADVNLRCHRLDYIVSRRE